MIFEFFKLVSHKPSQSLDNYFIFFHFIPVCNGPLLYDYTLIYKGSLDGTVLACVIGTILHLFLWIVIWLFLTVKQQWTFKLRVTVGRHMVRNARSIKFVNDIGKGIF